jgi:hypothetical protein
MGLVQTPEQLRFSLYALTVAMTNMPFLNSNDVNSSCQMNGVKTSDVDTDADDKFRNDNDVCVDKTSNVVSVDTSDNEVDDNNGDEDVESNEVLKNGDRKSTSTRKRSTADDDATSMDLKIDDDVIVVESVDSNGGSQAKRPKSTQNKDW